MGNLNHLRGKSIIDLLWEDLDETTDLLMAECVGCHRVAGAHTQTRESRHRPRIDVELSYSIEEYRGRAQGVAYALALMMNPYVGDVDAVRKLAKKRYEQRVDGKPMDPLPTSPNLARTTKEQLA